MKKIILLLICSVFFSYSAFSQDSKHTLSLGFGIENAYNEMVLPYNFNGASLNIDYDFERYGRRNWKSFVDLDLHISGQSLDHNFSTNKTYTTRLNSYHINFDVLFLRKIVGDNKFSIHAGLITSLQGSYQIITNSTVYDELPLFSGEFLNLSLAEGISASFQLRLKRMIFQNTTSYLLLTASLYPNYPSRSAFVGNDTMNNMVISSVNERSYISNKLKVEFPLYIKGKLLSSFAFSYNIKYEYSTIKDNEYKRFSNIFGLGIMFRLSKIDIAK